MGKIIHLINSDTAKKYFEELTDYIEILETQKDNALLQVSTWNKDKEIQKLKAEIKELQNTLYKKVDFSITEKEKELINTWINEHVDAKHEGSHYAGAIGGRYTYCFIPTSLGEIGYVQCACGDKFYFREIE